MSLQFMILLTHRVEDVVSVRRAAYIDLHKFMVGKP